MYSLIEEDLKSFLPLTARAKARTILKNFSDSKKTKNYRDGQRSLNAIRLYTLAQKELRLLTESELKMYIEYVESQARKVLDNSNMEYGRLLHNKEVITSALFMLKEGSIALPEDCKEVLSRIDEILVTIDERIIPSREK